MSNWANWEQRHSEAAAEARRAEAELLRDIDEWIEARKRRGEAKDDDDDSIEIITAAADALKCLRERFQCTEAEAFNVALLYAASDTNDRTSQKLMRIILGLVRLSYDEEDSE